MGHLKIAPAPTRYSLMFIVLKLIRPGLHSMFYQGVRKQIFYGGARRNDEEMKIVYLEKFQNFYYINPKKMGAQAPSAPLVPHPLIFEKMVIPITL